MDLGTSLETILDVMVQAVQDAVDGSGSTDPLNRVKSVVRGDRARPMPALPSVWIVPQPAQWKQADYGEEFWEFPVNVAALVKGDSPATAGPLSQTIAAAARAAVLACRESIRDEDVDIVDIVSRTFDPSARSNERNRTLFWTDATVTVTFTATG